VHSHILQVSTHVGGEQFSIGSALPRIKHLVLLGEKMKLAIYSPTTCLSPH
jgi:hypothetical protein